MALFTVCDLVLETNVLFPELSSIERGQPDLRLAFAAPKASAVQHAWFHRWELPDGGTWLQIARSSNGYVLRFPDYAEFELSCAGDAVICRPVLDTPPETIRHLFLDQVMPLLLSQRGELVLHASSVVGPQGAIAF